MSIVLAATCAWLLGGIPFGLVLVRLLLGVDVRRVGSGNIGATNASRAFGRRARLPVFLSIYVLDFAKGLVPTLWFPVWFGCGPGLLAPVLIGASAVLGHCASPYLRLRGGKGVATTTGVFAALELVPLAVALGVFFAVLAATRQVFLGSLALGVTLAAAIPLRDTSTAFGARLPVTVLALLAAGFLFYTHRSNLRGMRDRLRARVPVA